MGLSCPQLRTSSCGLRGVEMSPAVLHLDFRIRRVFSSPMKSLKINCPVRSPFPWKKDPAFHYKSLSPELSRQGAFLSSVPSDSGAQFPLWSHIYLVQKDVYGSHSEISNRLVMFYTRLQALPEASRQQWAMIQEG